MNCTLYKPIRKRYGQLFLTLLLLLLGLVTFHSNALAQTSCMEDVVQALDGSNAVPLNCTANDVSLGIYEVVSGPTSCLPGEQVDLFLQADLLANSAIRYDIGLFVALDGGNALRGSCYQGYLPSPLADINNYDPNSGTGPFFNAEITEDPTDSCGDLEQGVHTFYNLPQVTITCNDSDNDGYADVSSCVSWDNGTSAGTNSKPSCTTANDARPSTKAKCSCDAIQVGTVQVAGQIIVDKVTLDSNGNPLPNDPTLFTFRIDGTDSDLPDNFTLKDNDTPHASPALMPGSYSVQELSIPSEWALANASCVSDQGNPAQDPTTGVITVASGEMLTCTFTNRKVFVPNPQYTITKSVTGADTAGDNIINSAGELIHYEIIVRNDGNVSLTGIAVSDPLLDGPNGTLTRQADSPGNGDNVLNVGESWVYHGTYAVQQSDFNNNGGGDGDIDNTATVSSNELPDESDSAQQELDRLPNYTITKSILNADSAGDGEINQAGDVINYQVVVRNTGNVDLTGVTVTDPLITNLTGPTTDSGTANVLDVGEVWTYIGSYTVKQADLNADGIDSNGLADGDGDIDNTATVDSNELGPVESSVAQPLVYSPAYVIEKTITSVNSADNINVSSAGDVVYYQIVVRNEGNIDLTGVTVSDPLLGALGGPSGDNAPTGVLNVGEEWIYTGSYTVKQSDLNSNGIDGNGVGDNSGYINNTATANSAQLGSIKSSAQQPIRYAPEYTIEKTIVTVTSADNTNVSQAGDLISYQIVVRNTGNIDLTGVTVSDPLLGVLSGPTGDSAPTGVLNVNEAWTYTGNYTVKQSDLNSNGIDSNGLGDNDGNIDNTATVSSNELDDESSSTMQPILYSPEYSLIKLVTTADAAGDGIINNAGEIIEYEIRVTNEGNIDLTQIVVSDPLLGTLAGPSGDTTEPGVLNVGEVWIYSGSYTVQQSDIDTNGGGDGDIDNTATVDSKELDPESGSAEQPLILPGYTIEKRITSVDPSGNGIIDRAGEVINYTIVVRNDGNINLTNVSVSDPLLAGANGTLSAPTESITADGILAIGESWSYSGSYTVQQSDLNSKGIDSSGVADGDGDIDNTATVSSTELPDESSNVAETIYYDPDYSISKQVVIADRAGNNEIDNAGELIEYEIVVRNDGNIDLTGVTISDPLLGALSGPIGDDIAPTGVLNVGEVWTYTGSYTVQQSDLNSKGIDSSGAADGDGDIDNRATVASNELPAEWDDAAQALTYDPDYSISKRITAADSAGNNIIDNAGELISYQITVRNDGNIDLTGVTVADPLLGTLVGPNGDGGDAGVLDVGEVWTYTGSYTVQQADLNSNGIDSNGVGDNDRDIDNVATVSSDQLPDEEAIAAQPIVYDPDYSIVKQVTAADRTGDGIINNAGELIEYQIVVRNDGNIDLNGVSVSDPLITNLAGPTGDGGVNGLLEVGEVWTYTGSYAVQQSDFNTNGGGNGKIDNTATVVSDELPDETSSAEQPIALTSDLRIVKRVVSTDSAGNGLLDNAGEIITYEIVVSNGGNADLTGVTLSDPLLEGAHGTLTGPSESGTVDGILAVGESWTYSGSYIVQQSDIDSNGGGDGDIDNTATADSEQTVAVSAQAAADLSQSAALTVDKQVSAITNPDNSNGGSTVDQAGDKITYAIVVRNVGNQTLTNVTVDDDLTNTTNALCGTGTLAPGQSCTVTVSYTVTQADIDSYGNGDGQINNSATADSTETGPTADTAAVEILRADLSLVKNVDNGTPAVDETIRFTLRVANAGPAVATGVAVEDVVPPGYRDITNVSNSGTVNGNIVSWSGLSIPVGGAVDLTFEVTVNPPTGSANGHLNTAQVTASNQGDPDSTPNNDDGDQSEDDEDNATVTVRGSIYIAKITMGGDGTFDFDTSRDPDSTADFSITTVNGSGEELTELKHILPGSYTITELVPVGWALTDTYCLDSSREVYRTTDPVAAVDLQPGQVLQCYFVNVKLGTITLIKRALGANGSFGFDSTLGGGVVDSSADFTITTSNGSGSRSFANLMPGTYPVREVLPSGWALTNLTCSGDGDGDTTVNLGTQRAEIHLDAGENISCTFENTRYGSIKIVKELSDANGLDRAFDFSSSTLGNNSFTLTTSNGSASRTFGSLLPGNYDASELVPIGWQLKQVSCSGADTSDVLTNATGVNITLAAGENLTCTFVNDPLPTAVVEKSAATTSIMEPGDSVLFTVVVRNTSTTESVTLTDLVDDTGSTTIDLSQVCPLPTTPLAPAGQPGDRFTCTFTTNVTGAPGEYTDVVTATLHDDENNVITPSDSATVTIFDVGPAASVSKVASPTTLPEPGGPVTFTVTVRNLSTAEALTLNSLIDDPFGNVTVVQGAIVDTTCRVPRLINIGGSYSCQFTANVTGQPGDYSDTVTATLVDNDGGEITPSGDASVRLTDVASSITVIKSAMPAAVPEAGGYVTFTVDVRNSSTIDAITINAIDDDIYGQVCASALPKTLAPGQNYLCEFVHFVTGETGDEHHNTATVSATDDDGKPVEGSDDATVLISDTPATLHVHKQANVAEISEPGGDVTFEVVVENQSTVDLITLESVVDDQFGDISASCTPALPVLLDLGESVTCLFTERISGNAGDIHINEVTATGTDDDGLPVSDSDQEEVRIDNVESSIKVLKLSDPTSVPEPGGMVTFTVLVTNTSTVDTVTIQAVVDDQFGSLNTICGVGATGVTLAAGETLECTFSEYVSGPTGGLHTNTVTATGVDDEGNPLEDYDVEHVDILDLPSALLVTKLADRNTVPESGALVTFTVMAQNASLVDTIRVEEVVDDIFGDISNNCVPTLPTLLAPSESVLCSFSEFIDGATGSTHRNVVTVSGTDDEELPVSGKDDAEVDIIDVPSSINVVKTASRTSVPEPGDDVTFIVTVENTSAVDNVILRRLDDDQFGDLRDYCSVSVWPVTLTPGQILTCTFTEFIGGDTGTNHRNVVTASGVDDDGVPVRDVDDELVGITDLVPTITVSKDAYPTFIPESGAVVTFTVAVVNNSQVEAVTIDTLIDSVYGDIDGVGSCRLPRTLSTGASYECAFSRFVAGDVNSDHINVVTATAHDDEENPVTDQDDARIVFGDTLPTIEVIKQAAPTAVLDTSEPVTFTIEVINTGQETVTLTSLDDTVFGDLDGLGSCATPQVIGIGEHYRCQFTETVAGAAGTAHYNVVQAIAVDNEGNRTTDTDDATVTIGSVEPLLDIFKSADLQVDTYDDPADAGKITPGDTLRYHITVVNRGNGAAEEIFLEDIPDAKTFLITGSVRTSKGTILEGNADGDTKIRIYIGTLAPNGTETVDIWFDVLIDPDTESTILRNQATVTRRSRDPSGTSSAPSDDPSTPKEDDPTLTEVVQIPTSLPEGEEPQGVKAIFLPIVFR